MWVSNFKLRISLEKYFKKLTGNTEIESALQRLDRVTQEEVMLASTELHRITHSVEGRVMGVGDRVEDVRSDVQNVNRSSSHQTILHFVASNIFVGTQLRDSLQQWLSPPNPSVNHNIASKAHHNGTSQWFFHGRMFKEWKATGSFLWVHGKRAFLQVLGLHSTTSVLITLIP